MVLPSNPQTLSQFRSRLKRYARCLIRYASTQAMDPHLYFEKKYASQIDAAESEAVLLELIDSLISWFDAANFRVEQLAQLDQLLTSEHLPTANLMQGEHRAAALALLHTNILTAGENLALRRLLTDPAVASADRALITTRLAAR